MNEALENSQLEEEIAGVVGSPKVKVCGLEAASFQRRMLTRIFSLKNLKETLNTPPKSPEQTKEADPYRRYLRGDVQAYVEQNEEFRTEEPDFYRTALLERNADWIPKIIKLHAKPGVGSVMVGVSHSFGDKVQDSGVLDRLREHGFTVTRVGASKRL